VRFYSSNPVSLSHPGQESAVCGTPLSLQLSRKEKGIWRGVTLETDKSAKINTQHVPQNAEENGRGKELKAVWGDENE
jgi:hypothetical protein